MNSAVPIEPTFSFLWWPAPCVSMEWQGDPPKPRALQTISEALKLVWSPERVAADMGQESAIWKALRP